MPSFQGVKRAAELPVSAAKRRRVLRESESSHRNLHNLLWKMIDVLQETLCDHFSDDTLTSCCFLTKAINRQLAYHWFKRFDIVPENASFAPFPALRIRGHKGFTVMSLCPLFTDYKPIRSLFCLLSESIETAVSELGMIGRFTSLHRIQSLVLSVRGDYLPDIESLLWQHCQCPDVSITGNVSLRGQQQFRRHHFKGRSWDHIVSLSASSSIMFTPHGRRITLDMLTAKNLRELHLKNTSMSPQTWNRFLAKISIPDLSLLEIDGHVSLNMVCSFLSRHIGVTSLTLGASIVPRSSRSEVMVLPHLTHLQAPVRLALPFLRVNTTLTRLSLQQDPQSTIKDFREVLLSLVGTAVYSLAFHVDAERMQEFGALYVPTCLRSVQSLSLKATDVFSPSMLTVLKQQVALLPCLHLLFLLEQREVEPRDNFVLSLSDVQQGETLRVWFESGSKEVERVLKTVNLY